MAFSPGLAQYSGDPRTEWNLNAYRTKQSLLEAVANLPYKGGNTLTGMVDHKNMVDHKSWSQCQDFTLAPVKIIPVADPDIIQ